MAQNKETVENLTKHLNFLASDESGGRKTKTIGAKKFLNMFLINLN